MVWAGQFGVVNGQASEETPWVGVYPDQEPDSDGPADLYMILEPALPGSEEFLAEMKDAIADIFHDSRYTLTGGILRALRSAHENLRDWNRRSLKEHRVAAGLSCVATRDGEVFLAQVGPARAALLHQAKLQQFEPTLPESKEPLGLEEEFYPEFHRFEIGAGDRLLITTPSMMQKLAPDSLAQVMAMKGEQALPALYEASRSLDNCGAVLIAGAPVGD
jgi:hypothetical protein